MMLSKERPHSYISIFSLHAQPPGTIANTTASAAPTHEKPKSPTTAPRARGKKGKGKGKGKAKPEIPEETDPRKLEMIRWVSAVYGKSMKLN